MLEKMLKRASLVDVIIALIGAFAIIGVWRGVWNLMDEFLLVNNFVWSQVVSIVFGVVVLVILSRIGGWNKK